MTESPLIERIRGVRIETGAHRPFPLDNPDRVYFVERGYLDIFAVEWNADEVAGRRHFVARVPAKEMAFGSERIAEPARTERTFGFLAVPSLDAIIIAGERTGVAAATFDLEAVDWIDKWISHLSAFLVRDRPPPRNALLLEADPDIPYPSGAALSAQHKDVIWASANAPLRLVGRSDMIVAEGDPLLPITEQTYFEIDAETQVSDERDLRSKRRNGLQDQTRRAGVLRVAPGGHRRRQGRAALLHAPALAGPAHHTCGGHLGRASRAVDPNPHR